MAKESSAIAFELRLAKSDRELENTRENIPSTRRITKLKSVLLLTSIYFVVQIIAALSTKSLALLADAGHMLADVGGLALVLFAINYTRRPATIQHTYGFYRVEILAALKRCSTDINFGVYFVRSIYENF
jgi:cobalt-zinc-cadmium efflux system protein